VEGWAQTGKVLEHVAANISDHALSEPIHAVETCRTCEREDQPNAGKRREIFVDEIGLDAGEAEIDHAPHRHGHGERRSSRDEQRGERRGEHGLVAEEIRLQRKQRLERGAPRLVTVRISRDGLLLPVLWVGSCVYELHKERRQLTRFGGTLRAQGTGEKG